MKRNIKTRISRRDIFISEQSWIFKALDEAVPGTPISNEQRKVLMFLHDQGFLREGELISVDIIRQRVEEFICLYT